MCVRELAQLKRVTSMSKYQDRSSHGWPTHIYRDTPSNRAVGQIKGALDALTNMHRMHPAASGAPVAAMCPCSFKDQWLIQQLPDASDAQHPMRSSKGPELVLTH
jgi:hypothetical protein